MGLALEPETSGFEGSLYYLSTMSTWVRWPLWASVLWLQTIPKPPSSAKTLFTCPFAKWTPPLVCPRPQIQLVKAKLTIYPLSWILFCILQSSKDAETWEFSSAPSFPHLTNPVTKSWSLLPLGFLESVSSFILVLSCPESVVQSFPTGLLQKRPG